MEEECKGGDSPHEPGAATQRGQAGKASVTGSPDRGGIHSLIGVIDTARLRWYFSDWPKRAFKIPIPETF